VFDALLDESGVVLAAVADNGAPAPAGPTGTRTVFTIEPAGEVGAGAGPGSVDARVRAAAREIAQRLSVRLPPIDRLSLRGRGELRSVPFSGSADDIDLDRTVEAMVQRPELADEDVVVRDRLRTPRSVVLAVDLSGSMKDDRLRTTAATVGALAASLVHDELAVVAFWSEAAWLRRFGGGLSGDDLIDALMAMPARGLTNVALPLELAASALAHRRWPDGRVVLLSDCVHNAGEDPRLVAAGLPRLDVLLDVTGEKDLDLGRDLARVGRGRLCVIGGLRDVAPSLSAIFAR
jgi:Mg-chelatase subunit ChlD